MPRMRIVIVILVIALFVESAILASLYLRPTPPTASPMRAVPVLAASYTAPFNLFNQPITNDTEYSMNNSLAGSWAITLSSRLMSSGGNREGSEAQIAIAPAYQNENLSIPTIIVQERGDGLLRIEYYAQNWKNTYGLVLYNSTSPGWKPGENITLSFFSYGPPSPVNPEVAPYPNGNLTISIGDTIMVPNFPIAWANLANFYLYGLGGSTFVAGSLSISVYEVSYED